MSEQQYLEQFSGETQPYSHTGLWAIRHGDFYQGYYAGYEYTRWLKWQLERAYPDIEFTMSPVYEDGGIVLPFFPLELPNV